MNRLEERLRTELPELADALVADQAMSPTLSVEPIADILPSDGRHGQGRRRASRWMAAAVAVALGISGLGLAVDRLSRNDEATQVEATSEIPTDFGVWASIAEAPIAPRPYAVTAWTGSEVVFWAGSSLSRGFAHSDGAIYNPTTDSWDPMVVPGWGHPGLTSVFFDGELYGLAKGGGTRFDPIAGEWHDLPQVEGMWLAATVATNDAVWGIGPRSLNTVGQPDLAIARYEPASDSWSYRPGFDGTDAQAEIVTGLGRLESTVAWTGSEIIVWGEQDGGIAFDPAAESWRTIAPPQTPTGFSTSSIAVSTDDGLALLVNVEDGDSSSVGVATRVDSGWHWLDTKIPVADFESMTVAAGGDWLVGFSAGQSPVTIHLPTGAWRRHEDAPVSGVQAPNTAWTGEGLIVWGGASDDPAAIAGARWTPPS